MLPIPVNHGSIYIHAPPTAGTVRMCDKRHKIVSEAYHAGIQTGTSRRITTCHIKSFARLADDLGLRFTAYQNPDALLTGYFFNNNSVLDGGGLIVFMGGLQASLGNVMERKFTSSDG